MSNDQKASAEAIIHRLMDTSNKLGNVETNGLHEDQDDLLDSADGCIQQAISLIRRAINYDPKFPQVRHLSEEAKDAIAYANAEMVKRAKANR